MKKLKFLFITLLGILAMTLSSCNYLKQRGPDNYDVGSDSTFLAQFESVQNPQFESIEDIVAFRENYSSNMEIDSVFFSLSSATVQNVASVLLKKKPLGITKRDIVEEYRANKGVYDNLPTELSANQNAAPTQDSVDLSSTDLGSRRDDSKVISTRFSKRTDTIDGKPVKIIVKTEESYE